MAQCISKHKTVAHAHTHTCTHTYTTALGCSSLQNLDNMVMMKSIHFKRSISVVTVKDQLPKIKDLKDPLLGVLWTSKEKFNQVICVYIYIYVCVCVYMHVHALPYVHNSDTQQSISANLVFG